MSDGMMCRSDTEDKFLSMTVRLCGRDGIHQIDGCFFIGDYTFFRLIHSMKSVIGKINMKAGPRHICEFLRKWIEAQAHLSIFFSLRCLACIVVNLFTK